MPSKWKYIWNYLVILLVVNLTACSGPAKFSPTNTVRPPAENSNSNTVITFAAPAGQRSFYEVLITAFNQEHADIRVQFVPLENSSDLQTLASSTDTGILSGPDIFTGGAYFTDLQPLMDADPTFQPNDFWPGLLQASQDAQGDTACIPLTVGIHGIYLGLTQDRTVDD